MAWHRKVTFSPSCTVCGEADRVTSLGVREGATMVRWARTRNTSVTGLGVQSLVPPPQESGPLIPFSL